MDAVSFAAGVVVGLCSGDRRDPVATIRCLGDTVGRWNPAEVVFDLERVDCADDTWIDLLVTLLNYVRRLHVACGVVNAGGRAVERLKARGALDGVRTYASFAEAMHSLDQHASGK